MDVALNVITTIIAIVVIPMLVSVALFFVKAAGVFKIARNRGFNNAWFAFIPIANTYLLGEIADDVNARVGKRSGFKFFYLASQIVTAGLSVVSYSVIMDVLGEIVNSELITDNFVMQLFSPLMAVSAICGLFSIIQIVIVVMVKYRIFMDYVPQNAVVYTVISTIFEVVTPFFMLSIAKKPSYSINQQNNPNWVPPQYGYQQYGQQQYNPQQQQPQYNNSDNNNPPQ